MAQVRPFSFAKSNGYGHGSQNSKCTFGRGHQTNIVDSPRKGGRDNVLNNMKPIKSRRTCCTSNFKTVNHFRANPAPPRTKALMSAMKLKEQQEYR